MSDDAQRERARIVAFLRESASRAVGEKWVNATDDERRAYEVLTEYADKIENGEHLAP
jgi:hypothetical protein